MCTIQHLPSAVTKQRHQNRCTILLKPRFPKKYYTETTYLIHPLFDFRVSMKHSSQQVVEFPPFVSMFSPDSYLESQNCH